MYRNRYRKCNGLEFPAPAAAASGQVDPTSKTTIATLKTGDLTASIHKSTTIYSAVPSLPLIHPLGVASGRGTVAGSPLAPSPSPSGVSVHFSDHVMPGLKMPRIYLSKRTNNFVVVLPDGDVLEGFPCSAISIIIRFRRCLGNYRSSGIDYRDNYPYNIYI